MGFFESYKRLTRNQKVAIGVAGLIVGSVGPYFTLQFTQVLDKQMEKDRTRRENMRKMQEERIKTIQKYNDQYEKVDT